MTKLIVTYCNSADTPKNKVFFYLTPRILTNVYQPLTVQTSLCSKLHVAHSKVVQFTRTFLLSRLPPLIFSLGTLVTVYQNVRRYIKRLSVNMKEGQITLIILHVNRHI